MDDTVDVQTVERRLRVRAHSEDRLISPSAASNNGTELRD